MKHFLPFLLAGLLAGCSEKYPYPGTIADVEKAILAEPLGFVSLNAEASGSDWVRYRMVTDASGL